MTDHIKILGAIANLLVGTWVAVYIRNMARQYKRSFWNPLLSHVIVYNVLIFVLLLSKYAATNFSENYLSETLPGYNDFSLLFMFALSLVMTAVFYALTMTFLDNKVARNRLIGLAVYGVIITLGHMLMVALAGHQVEFIWLNRSLYFLEENSIAVVIFFFARLLFSKQGDDPSFIRVRRAFGWLYIPGFVLIFSLLVLPGLLKALGVVMFLLYFNLIPWFWARFFFIPYAGQDPSPVKSMDVDSVCREFSVSRREKDILMLMLDGKSNREIEEMLFISYHTVKNHIYNLYQKLGINSRYELIHFFVKKEL